MPPIAIHSSREPTDSFLYGIQCNTGFPIFALDYIKENALKNCPALGQYFNKIIRSYAGTRNTPVADTYTTTDGDFIIEESPVKNFVNFAGYESPGLTSAPRRQ